MKKCNMWCLVWTLGLIIHASSMPQNPTTARAMQSTGEIDETLKHITNQLMEVNTTSQITFDTRTPPKVKQQVMKEKLEQFEHSHPGVAEPVDEDAVLQEETKKLNFYKVEKSTTDSGLSTWILLSGQTQSTDKPIKKSTPKNVTNTFVDDGNKVIKPLFKRKSTTASLSTTSKVTTTIKPTITTISTTELPEKTTKVTKLKASTLPNKSTAHYITKKTTASKTTPVIKLTTTTERPTNKVTNITNKVTKPITTTTITTKVKTTTESIKTSTKPVANETIELNSVLSPEAKVGELDLNTTTQQSKKKRPVTTTTTSIAKRKKNKHRRKRPTADDKVDTGSGTKLSTKHKDKPFGTQIYNYLSREVMPTVGVGLVGLMVTAGLASYFLYPFGPLRRSYDVDRRDKEPVYHYNDEYSGGIAEEEAIGKVIAGMPANSNFNTRVKNSRNTYMNRYRNVDQRYMQGTVENVQLSPKKSYSNEEVIMGSPKKNFNHNNKEVYNSYNNMMFEKKKSPDEQKFVVGNIPKEFQDGNEVGTPAVVPEHGPRNIEHQKENVFIVESVSATETTPDDAVKVEHGPRKRRQVSDMDNEIDVDDKKDVVLLQSSTTARAITTTTALPTTAASKVSSTTALYDRSESIFDIIKDLFIYKIRMGLQILQSKADSLSRYFKTVQARIDESYKEVQKQSNAF